MHVTHAHIERLTPAATYVATGTSRQRRPFGLLRSDENQALAGGCSR